MGSGKWSATKLIVKKNVLTLSLLGLVAGYCAYELGAFCYCEKFYKGSVCGTMSSALCWKTPSPETFLQSKLGGHIYCFENRNDSYQFQTSDRRFWINAIRMQPSPDDFIVYPQACTSPPDPALCPLLPECTYLGKGHHAYLFQHNEWHLQFYELKVPSRPEPKRNKLEAFPTPSEVTQVLNQPFHYLAKGSQSYVFESEDGQWIIKFFRLNRYRVKPFISTIGYFRQKQDSRQWKKTILLWNLYESCELAYHHLREETGLFYLHLLPTEELQQEIIVHDKLGRRVYLDADTTPFMIQKKGEPLYTYFQKLIETGNHEAVMMARRNVSNLLLSRSKKGMSDRDPEIDKNLGFIDGKPVFLDVGQFYYSPSLKKRRTQRRELAKITKRLDIWLDEHQ